MTDPQVFHIACPECDYSNIATPSSDKYKEVVYQPCNNTQDQQDHNMKDQIKCDSCNNRFDFYWCSHTTNKNDIAKKT